MKSLVTFCQAMLAVFKTQLAAFEKFAEWESLTSVAKNLTGIGDIVEDVVPEAVFA